MIIIIKIVIVKLSTIIGYIMKKPLKLKPVEPNDHKNVFKTFFVYHGCL